ncbi:MAG: hypothetical protein K0S74_414 [Chlamydiales bacterium]|jgi:hypothetical protein|nr:hypothetical protein [Chlamydiales bacterium]
MDHFLTGTIGIQTSLQRISFQALSLEVLIDLRMLEFPVKEIYF